MSLVTVRSYRDPIDAALAVAQLDSAGIPAVVADDHLVAVQWLYSLAIGGVKVRVDEADADAAREVLRAAHTAELANILEVQLPPAEGDLCPTCGSTEVRPSRLQRNLAALSLATGLPFVAWRRRWICAACGHSWKRGRPSRAGIPLETLAAERRVHEQRPYPIVRVIFGVLLGLVILYYVQLQIGGGR